MVLTAWSPWMLPAVLMSPITLFAR
jgi:hypothetical protein